MYTRGNTRIPLARAPRFFAEGFWAYRLARPASTSRSILTSLAAVATVLGAINDNAAITYLATLVPGFSDGLKYAVVAGAVTGGGLTIIANAPNPAGISLLKQYFDKGVSPARLLLAAIAPTSIMFVLFYVTRGSS